MTPLDRFFAKVNITDKCWLWIAGCQPNGYGIFSLDSKKQLAHKVSYLWFIGDIPEGLEIDHLCRVRNCVNPDHLEVVTHLENMRRGNAFDIGSLERYKTHCPQKHPYSLENTYRDKRGSRYCRKCIKIRNRGRL